MIGIIQQALNYDRNKNYKPRLIAASLFTQNESFGLSNKEGEKGYASKNLPFDLLIDESHSLEFDITDHAVENGSVISDHVQQRLRSVSVRGMFTNHSINSKTFVNEDTLELDGPNDLKNVTGFTETARVRWLELEKLALEKSKVRLVTSLKIYDEMVIEGVSADRGPADGEAIIFDLRLREIRTASVKKKSIGATWEPPQPAKLDSPKKKAVSKKKKKGKKSGQSTDAKQMAQKLKNMKQGRRFG